MGQIRISERGVGMMEFALIIPVVVLLVAGLIDYGHLIRQMNTLSLVARDAARTASAHARTGRISTPGEVMVRCGSQAEVNAVSCTGGNLEIRNYSSSDAANTPDSVVVAAKKAACLGLQSAELNAADFEITPQVVQDFEVAGNASTYSAQEIRLLIKLSNERNCLLCWGKLLAQVPMRGDSVFILEDQCR